MARIDNRKNDQIRDIKITRNYSTQKDLYL